MASDLDTLLAIQQHGDLNPAQRTQLAQLQQQQGSSGSGSNGFQPLSAPDVAALRSQVYDSLQPYYLQLAKEAQGDFTRAVQKMQEDYVTGVRNKRIDFAQTQKQQTDDLRSTLSQLGITDLQDQNKTIDNLNQRGMAVYQNNPDGTPNVVSPSTISADAENYTPGGAFNNTSTITNPAGANLGEGGYELAQMQKSQQLQQEAAQRAATRPIEAAGIQLKQYTSLPNGIDPNQSPDQLAKSLAAPGVDRSKLGSAEQDLVRGQEQSTRDLQSTQEQLANQRSQDINSIATPLAQTGTKTLDANLSNQLQKEQTNNFVNSGT